MKIVRKVNILLVVFQQIQFKPTKIVTTKD